VWLLESLFRKEEGGVSIQINPALGTGTLVVESSFNLLDYTRTARTLGYVAGPPRKLRAAVADDLLWRMGVCIAIAMNAMSFAFAEYAGLADVQLLSLFHKLTFALSVVSVAIGGSVFFDSAWKSVKAKAVSLDIPIALGIFLAFASSAHSYLARKNAANYLDTLDVFIALMLVGRWLQRRVIARSRNALLATAGIDQLLTRRVSDGRPVVVPCSSVSPGDQLMLAPGDLVPMRVELTHAPATFSLDWITGESDGHAFAIGDEVPAGAFLAGRDALLVTARERLEESDLVDLLHAPPQTASRALDTKGWQRFSGLYVVCVLALAAAGFLGWWLIARDIGKALDVTTALLIVTCPCAFGIAAPLAQELAHARLRKAGLFPRDGSLLDRVCSAEAIVFDKTGTLTTGALAVTTDLSGLSAGERRALFNLACRSTHPKSRAVTTALADAQMDPTVMVNEVAGAGLETVLDGVRYRLGSAAWVSAESTSGDLFFRAGNAPSLAIQTREQVRGNVRQDVDALSRLGKAIYLLSGDTTERARAIALEVGIPLENTFGHQTPQGKATWVAGLGRPALFIGDGINDALAIDAAHCSGTPAVDRPFVASRAQFYFTTPGLAPLTLLLRIATRLRSSRRRLLTVAFAYNGVAISLSYLGVMSPLFCAVLMPLSSLSAVGYATASMKARSE
jgi:Cu2+-exporting ATPase